MVLIWYVLLSLYTIAFNVQGVRQTLDLHGKASRLGENAAIAFREQAAVVGHVNLNTVRVYRVQAESGACQQVVKKVSDFAKEELASLTQGRSIDVSVDESFLNASLKAGPQTLLAAFSVLDQSDLRDTMLTGEVWTLDDQDMLIACETGKSIRLEEENRTDHGKELTQGDMLMPLDMSSFLQTKALIAEGARWGSETWPHAEIHYCFHPKLDERAKAAFVAAINHTAAQVPCLSFSNVGYNEEAGPWKSACVVVPSILVQDIDPWKCWSYVGFQPYFLSGNSQPLNLGYPCWTMAIAAHELGHTLGMVHEMSRMDRDNYITVHWDNIQNSGRNNFRKLIHGMQDDVYDPLSLMQYAPNAFAKDTTKPTISGVNPKMDRVFGQRQGWSEQDVMELFGKYCHYGNYEHLSAHPFVQQRALLTKLVGDYKLEPLFSQLVKPPQYDGTSSWNVRFDEDASTCSMIFSSREQSLFQHLLSWLQPVDSCKIRNACSKKVLISCPGAGIQHIIPQQCVDIQHNPFPEKFWKPFDLGTCGVFYIENDVFPAQARPRPDFDAGGI